MQKAKKVVFQKLTFWLPNTLDGPHFLSAFFLIFLPQYSREDCKVIWTQILSKFIEPNIAF